MKLCDESSWLWLNACVNYISQGTLRGRQLHLNPLTTLQRSTILILQVRKEQFRELKPPTLKLPQDSGHSGFSGERAKVGLSLNTDWASPVAQTVKNLLNPWVGKIPRRRKW